jgi:hypothetical protein
LTRKVGPRPSWQNSMPRTAPAGKVPGMVLGMMFVDGLLEFKMRKELQELGENDAKSWHG